MKIYGAKWSYTPCMTCKVLRIMKLTSFFLLLGLMQLSAASFGQQVYLQKSNATLKAVLKEIAKQTDHQLVYTEGLLKKVGKLSVELEGQSLDEALKLVFRGQPITYTIDKNTIVLRDFEAGVSARPHIARAISPKIVSAYVEVRGRVADSLGMPLPGASVRVINADGQRTAMQTSTDEKGEFILRNVPEDSKLEVTYIGYQLQIVSIPSSRTVHIKLEPLATQVEDVIITGIFSRDRQSFTGSAATFSGEELREVGVQNVIQSLRTLDPAFNLIENNQFGSDPNRLPDLEIRGKTSIVGLREQFGEDPNQPLFILDGFETTLQTIMDLSMDRIASATILKDAASTAIYGAKAANGVVVIETKMPGRGKVRISYNGSADLSFADLTDYNLMNAREKLEFEEKSGRFKSNLSTVEEENNFRYHSLVQEINRGVDTYWLAEPLRTGLNQRNNLFLEGGDQEMRYGLGVSNRTVQGVMKNSKRNNLSGNIDLIYRKGKISFMNKFSIDHMDNRNPIVAFSDYSRANPYYRKYNEQGGVDKWLEQFEGTQNMPVPNPLWNDALNSENTGRSLGFRNNLNLEYRPFQVLNIRGRVGIDRSNSENVTFYSPDATQFDGVDPLRRGSYDNSSAQTTGFQGDISATYGQVFRDVHRVNLVAGASLTQSESISKGFRAEGFPEGNFTTPAFSNSYPESGKPAYSESMRRNAGFFVNSGYSFKNRYLLDLNLRSDGTSVFGSNRLFSTTWSAGVAWNIHEEAFMLPLAHDVSMLKLRASVGNPGNQNFGSFNALTTYRFNNWLQNQFGTGLFIDRFGDPDLEWQKTLDKNVGFDVSVLRNRLHVTFDYYHKKTDPLLASVGIPLSVGISSRLMNVGMQVDQGFSGTIRYSFLYRPQERINWTTSLTFRSGTAYYDEIGNRLDAYNQENLTKNLSRYYNGASPTALWSVVSMGIDPASGREIFRNLNGDFVYNYSFADEVVVGDTRPTLEGVFGNTFMWKGFSANVHIRYSFGGDQFNSTLYSKVENISSTQINMNQDKRALYDRWQEVGDKAQFKGISLNEYTPMSSRFVQENNYLSVESVRIGYDLSPAWVKALSISHLQVNAYMNEILRISSIKTERGIDFPFARTVTFGLNINFF